MTNREWVLNKMQNMSDEKIAGILSIGKIDKNFIEEWCRKVCEEKANCKQCRKEWLQQEHKDKAKLSEAERVILENIDEKYQWIARDENKHIYVYTDEPVKEDTEWSQWVRGGKEEGLRAFNHLFQFIKWEDDKPYNIDDLLQ